MAAGPFVVDTNVVVAGLLTREAAAPTACILDAMVSGALHFLLSEALLAEYRAVLLRPKIVAVHGLDEGEVDEILVRIATNGALREVADSTTGPRGDGHLFALLAAEPSARLVTGDVRVLRHAGSRGSTPRAIAGQLAST
jgi:predicted nucleic acid-binding protein